MNAEFRVVSSCVQLPVVWLNLAFMIWPPQFGTVVPTVPTRYLALPEALMVRPPPFATLPLISSLSVGAGVPMPTLLVGVVLVPLVVHCARASREWESVAPSASRQSAAERTILPRFLN